jgi:hypothetical protein
MIKLKISKFKKGNVLMENIVFIILNLIFLTILILFLLKQGSGAIILEQSYAKQIALLIDASKPETEIYLNMEKGKELAEKNGLNFKDIVKIYDNIITVKLSKDGGYSYSFFNDVELDNPYPVDDEIYRFKIVRYRNE